MATGAAGTGVHPDHLLALQRAEADRRRVTGHERVALAVHKAHRLDRWARRVGRLSDRLSRAAHIRLARLP